jgi:predicted phage terminase large subunit-like protein
MIASVEDRWELLRGLLDTDGYAGQHTVEYTTVSKALCDDVVSLVRSLGGRATISTKIGSYRKNGVAKQCRLVYRIVIIFNSSVTPFSLSRKNEAITIKRDVIKKFIDHVEYVGKRECQCIMVDDPSQLYITDDYIITHNTTLIIFFLTWVMGKDPLMPNLYSGYADKLCRGTFDGILSIMKDPEYCYKEIFPDSPIATTNAKDESIDLVKQQRFKTFTARSLDSGLTGATRCENILVLDDAVSGIEEAMNLERLDSLWMKVTNDLFSRAKESCRILLVGTRWSCHDVLGRMEERYSEDRKSKFIRISALDEDGNSNFDYKHGVGFSRAYFENMRENMDDVSWRAIYQQEPIEREGLLYQKDQLQHFFELPEAAPDAIVAICDSKNQGKDYVCALCGYVYGDSVYIPSLVFNNGLPEVTKPLVAQMCVDNKVSRIDIESNNGGEYYAQSVDEQIHKLGGFSSVRTFFTSTNKITKIITESDFVKKHFVFLDESKYPPDEAGHEYKRFMQNVLGFTITGKVKHDDGPDGLAMLSQLVKDLSGMEVRIVDRRSLPL